MNPTGDAAIRAALLDAWRAVRPDLEPEALDPREPLREQLDVDSLDLQTVAQRLYETLGINVAEVDYPRLDELDGAVAWLRARLGG